METDAKDFPVVCVGGSAGGLDAYIRLLHHLPADMGVGIVIVNHLRTVATMLHEILPRYTEMPVELITEGLLIQPNRVFIIPEKRDLQHPDHQLRVDRRTPDLAIEGPQVSAHAGQVNEPIDRTQQVIGRNVPFE